MSSKEKIKKEIAHCINDAQPIMLYLKGQNTNEHFSFLAEYQKWYSKSLKIIDFLAPERRKEFVSYYEIDPKRKHVGFGTYVIHDFIRGIVPSYHLSNFDIKGQTLRNVFNQLTILNATLGLIDNAILDIQDTLYSELLDQELEHARKLIKTDTRAAGVLSGIILENYLHKLIKKHHIHSSRRKPNLEFFNILLKDNNIYDATTARKISYLADIRYICTHLKKDPSEEQIMELIDGVNWTLKNIF